MGAGWGEIVSALLTEARAHPAPVLMFPSLPPGWDRSWTLPKWGKPHKGRKGDGDRDGTAVASRALSSPLFAAGGEGRSKSGCCWASCPHQQVHQGLGLCQVLPALFVCWQPLRISAGLRPIRAWHGCSHARLYLGRHSWQHPAPALGTGRGSAPGCSITCGAPEPGSPSQDPAEPCKLSLTWPSNWKVVGGLWRGW